MSLRLSKYHGLGERNMGVGREVLSSRFTLDCCGVCVVGLGWGGDLMSTRRAAGRGSILNDECN
jgi:hypothetical protein